MYYPEPLRGWGRSEPSSLSGIQNIHTTVGKRGAYSISRKTTLYRAKRLGQGSMVEAEWNPGKSSSRSPLQANTRLRIPHVTNTKVESQWVHKPPVVKLSIQDSGARCFWWLGWPVYAERLGVEVAVEKGTHALPGKRN